MKRRVMTLSRQKSRMGLLFVIPWIAGFMMLFAIPMINSFRFSISEMEFSNFGWELIGNGFSNYNQVLTVHPEFNRILVESITMMAVNVPLILFFSLFSAVLLNQNFRGRSMSRAIFFLPVILASGVIAEIESVSVISNYMDEATSGGLDGGEGGLLQSFKLEMMLFESGLHPTIVFYLTGAVNRIYDIISDSGVQILIFLAGLQSISPSIYEAAKMEGATGYESFWKITFPLVSPLLLTNIIYTVINSFTDNEMTRLIQNTAFASLQFGLSAAMSWIYFISIAIILLLLTQIISKKVFYHE